MKSSLTFTAIIDRIENSWAILEVPDLQEAVQIPVKLLPESANESDCLHITIEIDPKEKIIRQHRIQDKILQLINR